MKPSWPPPLSRDALSGHFLRVRAQLDALQPPARAALPCRVPDDSNHPISRRLLPSRERIAAILQHNQRFCPAEEVQQPRRQPAHEAATSPSATLRRVPLASSHRCDSTTDASTAADGALAASLHASPPQVLAPVGGRARVFPCKDLARAKRSMKKRSHALTDLHAAAPSLSGKPSSSDGKPGSSGGSHLDAAMALSGSALSSKQALISELVRRTNFSTQHIFHLSRKFKEIVGTAKSVISFAEFRQILSDDVAALLQAIGVGADAFAELAQTDVRSISATISTSESFLRRLFAMFDGDGDGKIDFREFVVGLNGFVKGSLQDKVDALFDVYQCSPPPTPPLSAAVGRAARDDQAQSLEATSGQPSAKEEMTVAISDLLGLFQGDRQLYQELMRCVDEYFVRVGGQDQDSDDDGDGDSSGAADEVTVMNREEFVAVSLAEPSLLEAISRPTPSLMFSEDTALRERLKAFVNRYELRWRTMLAIQRRVLQAQQPLSSSSSTMPTATPVGDWRMPVATFLQILTQSVGSDSSDSARQLDSFDDREHLSLLLRPYTIKPTHGLSASLASLALSSSSSASASASSSSSSASSPLPTPTLAMVDVLALLTDLAVVLLHPTTVSSADTAADADAKARFHFELFDLNGDGVVSRTELVSAVCAGFAHFGPHLTDVVRVLESEDADHDGELTKQQYLRAAHRSPLIMASLYTCIR